VVVLLAATLAIPGESRAKGGGHLQQGIKLLNDMDDAKAIKSFHQALKEKGVSPFDKARIHLYIGIAQFNLMKKEEARQSFTQALKIKSDISLPAMTSPKINDIFATVRVEYLSRNKAPPTKGAKATKGSKGRKSRKARPIKIPKERPESSGRTGLKVGAWTTLGLAVAAAGAGVAMGVLSGSEQDEANDLSRVYLVAQEHHDKATTYALTANILFAAAGAAAITSGVLFYLGYRKTEKMSASVMPIPSGAMVQVRGLTW